jgi:hypothetical protein
MSPISRKQAVMVNNLTNINKTNSDGKKISPLSTQQTELVNNLISINKMRNFQDEKLSFEVNGGSLFR